MTLDREDPFGDYEHGNCRWATWDVQAMNKRRQHEEPRKGDELHVAVPGEEGYGDF